MIWGAFVEIIKSVFLLVVGALVKKKFEKNVKLVAYYEHVSVFKHTPPGGNSTNVFSHSVILRNNGASGATTVRIHHLNLPNFHIWPDIAHRVENLANGSADIVIPIMVPKEQITISYLYFPPLTYDQINSGIKCDQGFAQQIEVILQPKIKKWFVRTVWFFLINGIVSISYFIYLLYQWLSLKFV